MRKYILLISFFISYFFTSYAFFEKDIRVLTMQNGLADNTVSCIHKDKDGFMWFGTNNGLSRYDGKNLKNFGLDSVYLKIYRIRETDNDLLWMNANDQLYCFDRRMERFIPVNGLEKITRVQDELMQSSTSFWTVSSNVLSLISVSYRKDKIGNIAEVDLKVEMEYSNLADDETKFMALCQSPEGIIYIGTDWGNIIAFDPKTNQVINQGGLPKINKVHIHRLLYSDGYVWISSWANGAIRYNPKSDVYTQYTYKPENIKTTLSHADVYQIVPLSNGEYLTATWNGYTILTPDKDDPTLFTTEVYNNTASQMHRNLETRMISAYYDSEGIIWIGTQGGGVYASDLRKQFYQRFHQETHNEICGMATDNKNHIWLASFHKGILKSTEPFDPHTKLSFKPIASGTGNTVLCVAKDKDGNLWFGNNRSELIYYNVENEYLTVFPVRLKDNQKWKGSIWSLLYDSENRLWLGTSDGLLLFDNESKNFTYHAVGSGSIRAITQTPDKCIWLGMYYGLKKCSLQGNLIRSDYEKEKNITAREIRSLYYSSEGKLYIGYTDGLAILNTHSDSIENFYNTHSGLSNNHIGCIGEDAKGRIWIGTNSSVCSYNKQQKLFYNYYISGNNRSLMLYKDYLFWGNNKNMTYFLPDEAINDYPVPDKKVTFTQLEVDNKPVDINKKINDQIILTEGIPYTHKLTLAAVNNNFSLMFSNLTYTENLQKYSYRLTPSQSDWITAGDGEKVSFANLPQGEYVFEVRSIMPDGSSSYATTMAIEILPYWYETIWFRILLIAILLSAMYYMMWRMKREQQRLTHEERLKNELFVANLEREKEKQINRERSNFFTNVSHELRTPLTLILSPLQDLLQTERLSQTLHEKLSLVYNNATSLSTLVNQLLYVQKIEAGMVQLHLSNVDILLLVNKVMTSFKHISEIKQTEFILDSGIQSLELWVDAAKIESALQNLLSNAFKYTPKQGIIRVAIEKKDVDGKMFCLLSVTDDGPGIPKDLQERIFDSFITGKNNPSFSTKVGIGLRIVKNTMDMHHGTLLLDSSPESGSTFTLYIPIGKEHFKEDEYEWIENDRKAENEEPFPISQPSFENPAQCSGKKLLIVEDNEEIRSYLNSIFSKDYQVLDACDGDEGVKMASKYMPDLIISDIMMPVKDGFAFIEEIRQQFQTAHIPVIMLTAKAEEEDLLKSTRLGVDDYIMKPFNTEVLKAKVENLIRMREQLKRIYTKTLMLKQSEEKPGEEEQADPFMQQVIGIVEANLTNPDFSAKSLARLLNLSQPTLYRKMKQQSNLSIIEVIRSIRISKAASLIMQKKYSIQEVAEMVGYNDITTFRKHFTNKFGVSPSRYNAL